MTEHLHEHHEPHSHKQYPSKEAEIADMLKKQVETMQQDIGVFTRLAEQYYETKNPEGNTNFSEYTWEEAEIWDGAQLYTLIKYQGKDLLVQVGTGEFNTEMFTRKNIPELKWFSHSPLPLFVVMPRADQEHKDHRPKIFLNEHTMIYSPKWGQAELRTNAKQKEHPIDYGKSNGVMEYTDATLALQNAYINKIFSNEKMFEDFVDEIGKLKNKTYDELQTRTHLKENFLTHLNEHKKKLYDAMKECLLGMSDNNQERMYQIVQSFDTHKRTFIHNP